jgi:hypothetical protein
MGRWQGPFGGARRPEARAAVTSPRGPHGRGRRKALDLAPSGRAFEVNLNVLFQPDEVLREPAARVEDFVTHL